MKVDAITVAAVAVAGLAVATWARKRTGNTSPLDAVSQVYGMARGQRQDSGAAIAQNTAYLEHWSSPMADTLYSTGSLGD